MYKVEFINYDHLTDEEIEAGLSDNGCGKEYASYMRVTHNGKTIRLESDAMEREDASFFRDLSWIKEAFEEAYNLGRNEGRTNCV